MPITCPLKVRPLSPDEFQELDYRVMGHAFASQNELGRLCEEAVYQRDLQARLLADGFRTVEIEVPITVFHADFTKLYLVDLIADDAVYELKTVAALSKEHEAQLLNYLFLLNVPRGKLINLRSPKVEGRLHATGLSAEARRRVHVDAARWQELSSTCATLRTMMVELLADWGAFLDFELYQQALTHFCGGESRVVQRLPLRRKGVALGTQRFHVHSPGLAFVVTAVTSQVEAMETHLRRLLTLTRLEALQWINLNHSDIQFVTITR